MKISMIDFSLQNEGTKVIIIPNFFCYISSILRTLCLLVCWCMSQILLVTTLWWRKWILLLVLLSLLSWSWLLHFLICFRSSFLAWVGYLFLFFCVFVSFLFVCVLLLLFGGVLFFVSSGFPCCHIPPPPHPNTPHNNPTLSWDSMHFHAPLWWGLRKHLIRLILCGALLRLGLCFWQAEVSCFHVPFPRANTQKSCW